MSATAPSNAPNVSAEIERVFELQRAHQGEMKATTEQQRKAMLAKMNAVDES